MDDDQEEKTEKCQNCAHRAVNDSHCIECGLQIIENRNRAGLPTLIAIIVIIFSIVHLCKPKNAVDNDASVKNSTQVENKNSVDPQEDQKPTE